MKIEIYATAQAGQNKLTACAVVAVATADDGRVMVRRMAFPSGQSTLNVAALQAARIAALSVRRWAISSGIRIVVYTDSHYVSNMLQRDDSGVYRAEPKTNVDVVAALRAAFDSYTGLSLEQRRFDDGIGAACAGIARDAAMSQAMSDSGSKEHQNIGESGLYEGGNAP